ncbi:MAG: hypothetical protein J5602_04760 [Clostridia bacterium]|nr:hypothetical protein [Clostridia bacterium]
MTNPIRARLEAALPPAGAFLRCDRGGALYVTNLPAKCGNWAAAAAALEADGLTVAHRGGPLFIAPGVCWAAAFERWAEGLARPGELTRQLAKRRGMPVCAAETACWLAGMKRLELNDRSDYERQVRQAAAVALREKCGGLMYACGLCLDLMGGNES